MTNPLSTIEVLRAEASEIHGVDLSKIPDDTLALELNKLDSTALCISGGGIRSAVFGLGIIQALAGRAGGKGTDPLLGQFNYLSTVSGGGYIGGWLSAWLSRRPFAEVVEQLNGHDGGITGVEPTPIGDLRRDSNYLTPKVGLLSADTWAAAAMVIRNMLLNWILLIPLLLLSLIVLKLGAVGLAWLPHSAGDPRDGVALGILVAVSLILVLTGLRFTMLSQRREGPASVTQDRFLIGNLLPMLAAGVAWTGAVDTLIGYRLLIVSPLADLLVVSALFGVIVFGVAQAITFFTTTEILSTLIHWREIGNRVWTRTVFGWLAAGAVYGAFLSLGAKLLGSGGDVPLRVVLLFLFGPPWLLLSQAVAETCYVAATSAIPHSDEQREWLARSAGWYAAVSAFWIAGVALALLGSWAAGQAQQGADDLIEWLSSAGGIAAVIGLLTGGSSRTSAEGVPATTRIGALFDIAAKLAAPLFFALLLVIASALLDLWVLGESLLGYLLSYGGFPSPSGSLGAEMFQTTIDPAERWLAVPELLGTAVLLGIVALVASIYININRFSLHGLYRNRLVRAFLGASHIGRKPNRFTGFDEEDNVSMSSLWPKDRARRTGEFWRPFHVLTLTLNIVSTRNLAWQQRKAMPFTVSPLHCGAAFLGPVDDQPGGVLNKYRGAYRPSDRYAGAARDHGNNPGISLGTAMAVSGAAVNPNMGYHSSPLVALLLTLLNFRLGWWLGNPASVGDRTWFRNGPRRAALPLIMDALGMSTDRRPYVALSDGGHFDNLGLYEMVRRRCRYIVQSDGGADPHNGFSDLGECVRKIFIDFGIPVTFVDLQKLKPRPADPATVLTDVPYYAMAVIDYAAVDGPEAKPGVLLYVKSGYHNDKEGAGIRAYANTNPSFPDETTLDQWFSESQFESYRSLGYEIMTGVLAKAGPGDLCQTLDALLAQSRINP